jgi:hypothetical protein
LHTNFLELKIVGKINAHIPHRRIRIIKKDEQKREDIIAQIPLPAK